MARPKKGALHQVLVPMVDSTDFASIESGLTASQFNAATKKFYGWNTGASTAATSGTVSKAGSLVRSGIFRQCLKTTENNFDVMQLHVIGATGCAHQIIEWTNDDNVYSLLSDLNSNFLSRVPKETAARSQVSDIGSDLRSYMTGLSNQISGVEAFITTVYNDFLTATDNIYSQAVGISNLVSDAHSDLASKIAGITVTISESDVSDIASAVVAGLPITSDVSQILALLSDFSSNFNSRIPKEPAARSQLSDLHSDLRSYVVGISGVLSDTYSLLSDFNSNLLSRVPKEVAARSQLSDIGSDLRSYMTGMSGMLSDTHSAATAGASRALLNRSSISDVQSYLVAMSNALSDAHSDLASKIGNVSVAITASDISDIASAVVAGLPITSMVSDIYSLLSDLNSNILSRIPEEPASRSQLSALIAGDISDMASAVAAELASDLSNIHSAATAGASRALLCQSRISDVQSYLVAISDALSDAHSDLASKIGNVSVAIDASDISDLASAVVAALPITEAVSDIYSLLSDLNSNFLSRVPKEVAARSQLSDLHSDLRSYMVGMSGMLSDTHSAAILGASHASEAQSQAGKVYSLLSDLNSNFLSRIPKETAARSQLSDLISDVRSYLTGISGALSDVESAIDAGVEIGTSSMSDLRSAITGTTFTLDESSLSDIASAVWARAGQDPTGVPAVTASMGAKVDWLTAMSRNKIVQSDSVQEVRNDGDTDNIASAAVSRDATSLIRGEFA